MNKSILVDIDGTIADESLRRKNATDQKGNINWNKYFDESLLIKDKVNEKLKKRLKKFYEEGYTIVFLTGRKENLRDVTISWLSENDIPVDYLIMREQNSNYLDIEDFKTKKIHELKLAFDFEIAFEDLEEGIQALKNEKIKYEKIKFN
jgi:uncharacterized HAD superfamily protein